MDFPTVRALRGPNVWGKTPVLDVLVDLGPFHNRPLHEIPGFADRLRSWLPSLGEPRCASGACEGFFEQLSRGLTLAHVLERVAMELQLQAGSQCPFSKTIPTSKPGVYRVLIGFSEEPVVRTALETARTLCFAAIDGKPFDVAEELDRILSLDQDIRLGPSTGSIVRAAEARGIPTRRLNEGSLVQLGHSHRQHRILAAETDLTSAIAETIAQDKELTKSLLRAIGVPVPEGRPVDNAEDAWEAATDVGLPVVVKPQYGNHGRGVAVNLTTREQVLEAYASARDQGTSVIVERFAPGSDHRLLVIGDRLVAAARREPPQVTGNGRDTITQLVDEINQDPRRGEGHATSLSKLRLDAIAVAVLEEQGLTPESVLTEGKVVPIRLNANLSTGGTAEDVTDSVHPEVAARAVDAARIIGLDIAGVDVVALDLSRPLEDQGAVVVEVNAGPGLRMHLEPSSGTPRAVGAAIIAMMFPEGTDGRVPLVAVAGGGDAIARCVSHIVRETGKRTGLACAEGVFVNEHHADTGNCTGAEGARHLLLNPQVEAAVLHVSAAGILSEGLGFDRCTVAVLARRDVSPVASTGPRDLVAEEAFPEKIVVESVSITGSAVLSAEDPEIAALQVHCPGTVILFARSGHQSALLAHRQRGGRVAFLQQGILLVVEGDEELRIGSLSELGILGGDETQPAVETALAAAAAAWALGIPEDLIQTGLRECLSAPATASSLLSGHAAHAQNDCGTCAPVVLDVAGRPGV